MPGTRTRRGSGRNSPGGPARLRRTRRAILTILPILTMAATAATAEPEPVRVFAAASLTDALTEAGRVFQSATGIPTRFHFASSGTLARQIRAGAPADVFLSADTITADRLEADGLLTPGSRVDLLGNRLVLITPPENRGEVHDWRDLERPKVTRIAIGTPVAVPAGTYARTLLEQSGLWQAIQHKLMPCDHVRAVLAAVEAGNADAGVVYQTDAATTDGVRVASKGNPAIQPPIRYPVARVANSDRPATADQFIRFLQSEEAAALFQSFGFKPLHGTPPPDPRPRPTTNRDTDGG